MLVILIFTEIGFHPDTDAKVILGWSGEVVCSETSGAFCLQAAALQTSPSLCREKLRKQMSCFSGVLSLSFPPGTQTQGFEHSNLMPKSSYTPSLSLSS